MKVLTENLIPACAAGFAVLGLLACESVESEDVRTSGIYADYSASSSDGLNTEARAILKVGGDSSNTFVNLEGEDRLEVTSGGVTQTMIESNLGEIYSYRADFSGAEVDKPFVFALLRGSEDENAPDSNVSLPAPFALTAPQAGAVFGRAANDAIEVTWDAAEDGDSMEIDLEGSCFKDVHEELDGDPGTYVIEAGSLEALDDGDAESCEATLSVHRLRTGSLDPAFEEGGKVVGEQVREVLIRIDP